jgi:RHS repeat-associated protein
MYVSNESNTDFDVFFDDLIITHTKGKVLQEDHYYPFGLNISALSSTAPLSKPNRFLYNEGSERVTDFGLHIYETQFRVLDPVLGRWWQIDPASEIMEDQSPYVSMDNNPILFNDPLGDCPTCPQGEEADKVYEEGAIVENKNGKWEYLGNGEWKDIAPKAGLKVLPRRNGWDLGVVDFVFGLRTVTMSEPNSMFDKQYGVDYNGLIVGEIKKVVTGNPPDISPVGKIKGAVTVANTIKRLGTTGDNLINAAKNPKLKSILSRYFRKNATIGNGGSADAYRFTRDTGELVGGSNHAQKLYDTRRGLQKLWNNKSNLSKEDRQIVKQVLTDIQNALSGG